ncbi:uncharacterized protein LOC133779119 [Humulus lupulus]|uniref:uncharacterized protein LOC133779119 n=1 Tax=Humulus lupulus TaxID=3486 RepID=UPI002B4076BD|nr:uncharacterized protein LOC133779119 [Humulus lupulus]
MENPPILPNPVDEESLLLYMAILEDAINVALVREERCVQHPVYYVSKRLIGAESRYPLMEKLTFFLMMTSRKLRPYFQVHSIKVLTNNPLRQVLQKPESVRLLKCSLELSQFDITYHPSTAIKGQAHVDFITECTGNQEKTASTLVVGPAWKLFVDRSANENGARGGLILVSLEGHRVHSAFRFGFSAYNNETKYEALIIGFYVTLELKGEGLEIYIDSQLVVNQVLEEYQARGTKMAAYLAKAQEMLHNFRRITIQQVPREHNSNADALAKLATTKDAKLINVVPINYLESLSISAPGEVDSIQPQDGWMKPMVKYLIFGELPQDKKAAQKLLYQVPRYIIMDNRIYRQGYSMPLLRCVSKQEAS